MAAIGGSDAATCPFQKEPAITAACALLPLVPLKSPLSNYGSIHFSLGASHYAVFGDETVESCVG